MTQVSTTPTLMFGMCLTSLTMAAATLPFQESRLITTEHGVQLNEWANQSVGQTWELCYSSFTMDPTPAEFHKRCDQYDKTYTVAHNTGNPKPGKCEGECFFKYSGSGPCRPGATIGSDCSTAEQGPGTCFGRCDIAAAPGGCGANGTAIGASCPGCAKVVPNNTFGGYASVTWNNCSLTKYNKCLDALEDNCEDSLRRTDCPSGKPLPYPGTRNPYPCCKKCAKRNKKALHDAFCDDTDIEPFCNKRDPPLPCNNYETGTPANFLFRLGPKEPERYGVTDFNGMYQTTIPNYWPTWSFDLRLGLSGPPGSGATFQMGHTIGQRCEPWPQCSPGGASDGCWGKTDLEVWRLATP